MSQLARELAYRVSSDTLSPAVGQIPVASGTGVSITWEASPLPAAEAARDAAEVAQLAAEAARDAAIIGAGVYVDEPTGRAAVADGVAFKVQGSGDVAAYEYRRVNAGSSTLIATYPSSAAVSARAPMLYVGHPLRDTEDWQSGYPLHFWDYSNQSSYIPARYQTNALADTISLGPSHFYSKDIGTPLGLSVRFSLRIPSGSVPTVVIGLSSGTTAFDSNKNVAIWFANTNSPAACFRIDYASGDSSRTDAAGPDSPAAALEKTYHIRLDFSGTKMVVRYYSDATFSTVTNTYEKALDFSKYTSFTRFNIWAIGSGLLIGGLKFGPDYEAAEPASVSDKGGLNYLSPADFTAAAQGYWYEDWTRSAATISTVQPVGRFVIPGSDGSVVVKLNIDITNTVDGFLIGFGGSDSAKRALIGYEPAASYRGFIFYNGDAATFTRIVPVDNLVSGTYYARLSKKAGSYRAEIATDQQFSDMIGSYSVESANLDSQTLRISAKLVTAGLSLVEWAQYSERAISFDGAADQGALVPDGSNVFVTHFGGEGNDWCFVRTPASYTHSGVPHPMVILNHGNGWTMNGTVAKANFSEKTQFGVDTQNGGTYLDTGRADYVQYSSPLIELLLANGFVVCGAQNYGDSLYGNNNCRNAVADFYEWMLRNFNVKDRCHMIGASNGVMTTLNACHILGIGKVASIAGVYPLCDLIDHYLGYPSHRAGIESAYGLTPPYADKAALLAEAKLFTHCPVNHYVVGASDSTTVRTAPLPPMKLVASGGDTVTAAVNNGEKLRDLCLRSRLVCEYTDIDPGGALGYDHGDWHHFKEQEIVDFFMLHR